MTPIPRSALGLALAGVIPFAWGALTTVSPAAQDWGQAALGPRFVGPYVQLYYGVIILAFMSGVLWGFATRAEDGAPQARGYALSVLPALWGFFMTGAGPEASGWALIAGFVGLLGLDWLYWRWGLTPVWWLRLRGLLTGLVVLCLAVGVLL